MQFENKPPPKWRRKSIISFSIIIILAISTVAFLVLFLNPIEEESDSSDDEPDFPTIYLTFNENNLNKENYTSCIFELKNTESSEDIDEMEAEIKIRGETSATYPKKGYRLQLSKGESLLGMRDDDDWQLFASYYDYTRLKVKFSFNLWRNLLSVNPTAILPRSRYVLLYVNGNFRGLYLLAEKNDRKLFGLNETLQNNTDDSLIFQAKDPSNLSSYIPDKWEQDWPNEDEGYYIMDEVMVNITTFINYSTSYLKFFNESTGIFTKFYKNNLIDFFLFNYFILHKDFWNKNYFIIRDTNPSNFSLIPWDFDLTFGQNASDPIINPDEDPKEEILNNNLLYRRLLGNQSFRDNCTERWNQLRNSVWSNKSIFKILGNVYSECRYYLKADLNNWDQPHNPEDYINTLEGWISARLYFCDTFFKGDFLII
jgi:hypothetical protein